MPEGRAPISSARIATGDIARHSFAIVRRGFDTDEVRAYLQSVARSLEAIEEREQELRTALSEAEERAAHPVVDEAPLTASLGQHSAQILRHAHEEAARIVAQHLSRAMGQQIFIENRSGAAGVIGMEAVAKSPPDGYTVLVTTDFLASAAHVYKLNIDPLKDLIPVIQLARQPVVLAVHPALGVNSLAELVALAKQRPGLNYATGGGAGAEQHIVAEWTALVCAPAHGRCCAIHRAPAPLPASRGRW